MCIDKEQAHFFGIGDWGGVGTPGSTKLNPRVAAQRKIWPEDEVAQGNVAREMKRRAALKDPEFVLSAGDNFYPGGYNIPCTNGSYAPLAANVDYTKQFAMYHDNMYAGEGLDGKPWLSCLGNHDYGGFSFNRAWDVQVYRTWSPRSNGTQWRMPGQWWSQHVVFTGFTMDIFFLDSNFLNARPRGTDPRHNICQNGDICYAVTPQTCPEWFQQIWQKSLDFLRSGIAASTATWKVVVAHHPGQVIAPMVASLADKIDLLFTGHTHFQNLGSDHGIDWVLSGGGGGITSDTAPAATGEDNAYGFVDFTVSSTEITMDMLSWGGPAPGKAIVTTTKTIHPKSSRNFTAAAPSGVRDQTAAEALANWNNAHLDTTVLV